MTLNKYPAIGANRAVRRDTPEDWIWKRDALCRGICLDPDIFYPEPPKGMTGRKAAVAVGTQVRSAQKICSACPVRGECFEYAVRYGDTFGIYGGHHFGDNRRTP